MWGFWAWPYLVSASSEALLSAIPWDILPWMESPTDLPMLFWLPLSWVATQMHAPSKNNTLLKNKRLWENEEENFPQWDNVSWTPCGRTEKSVLSMSVWLPPQKPLPFLLESSPGCIREGNSFLQVLRQYWRKNTFQRPSALSDGSLLAARWSCLPVKSTTNSW